MEGMKKENETLCVMLFGLELVVFEIWVFIHDVCKLGFMHPLR